MPRWILLSVVLCFVAGRAPAQAESLIDPAKGVVGVAEIGEDRATVLKRLGQPVAANEMHAVFAKGDIIVTFAFPKDSVERVTVMSKKFKTAKGIRVGNPISKVLKLYGKDATAGSVSVPYHNIQAASVSYQIDGRIRRFLTDSPKLKGKVIGIEVEDDWTSF